MVLGIPIPPALENFFIFILPYMIVLIILVAIWKFLTKNKTYGGRMIEIKEAPIEINNILRDSVKRQILRSLRKQKKYVTAISLEINQNAPKSRYHLKQLEKTNLVKPFKLARETYFTLTKKGQWTLKAIDYYYPVTRLQFIFTRLMRFLGISKIRRFIFKEAEEKPIF